TLGEEFILFIAVLGVVLLLRYRGRREAPRSARLPSPRILGLFAVGAVALVGLWLTAFGYVTPGGGFQGGVAIASGVLLVYLTVGYRAYCSLARENVLDPVGAAGAGGFVVVGLAALVSVLPFLHNLLGRGEVGTVWSGGS